MTPSDGVLAEPDRAGVDHAPGAGLADGQCPIRLTEFAIPAPDPFDFAGTVRSHGWVSLAPNVWDAEHDTLTRAVRLSSGRIAPMAISAARTRGGDAVQVAIRHRGELAPDEVQAAKASAVWMLRLDEDFSNFYELCQRKGGRWNRVTSGLGRLLRSPTLFEDTVRTILTTNIQWGGTVRMVRTLVDTFGAPSSEDESLRAFPTPQAIAALPRDAFDEAIRLGYRGPYIHELASRIVSGDLDLEALRDPGMESDDLRRRLLAIKGVGSYAAATILMLLGRYDNLAVDTEFRQFVSQAYFDGRRVSDAEAMSVYDDWAEWRYLAYWFDLLQG